MSKQYIYPIWYVAKDIKHFEDKKDNNNIVQFPTEEDIKKALSDNLVTSFIAPYMPPQDFERFFIVKHLDNLEGLLTTQEKAENVKPSIVLRDYLGVSVVDSDYTFDDLAAAGKLKEWTEKYLIAEAKGYKSKGIFLVGLPGTGKTFFPQCLAGELKRPLIMLNLELLKSKKNPIAELNRIFEYLNRTKSKQIMLIDEVEKMIGEGDDPLTGRLMTILSDLNGSSSEYPDLNLLIFATANNLTSIMKNQPAFLRRGRFDELFFVNLPSYDDTEEIYKLYIKKYKLEMITNLYDLHDLIAKINNHYEDVNVQARKCIYTPSEIATFIKRLAFLKMADVEITAELIEENISKIIPIAKTGASGVNVIVGQKELFEEL